jgi:hypothetical protein
VLKLVHKAFHQMTFAVEPFIIDRRLLAAAAGRNDGCRAFFEHGLAKVIRIVALVGNDILATETRDQVVSLSNVVALPASQDEAQGVAERVYTYMDFGTETPSAASERLGSLPTVFFDAPAAQGWARTTVLSIMSDSMSGSLAKYACICSQIPSVHQRPKRLYTAFQSPYTAGSKRHCAPLRAIHSTPSTKRRHLASLPIRIPEHVRRNASTFFHCSLGSLTVLMPPLYAYVNTT